MLNKKNIHLHPKECFRIHDLPELFMIIEEDSYIDFYAN